MEKMIFFFVFFGICVVLSFQLGYAFHGVSFKCQKCPDCVQKECPSCVLDYECPSCICNQEECNKPNSITISENLVSEMGYKEDYNCDEFSWELLRRYNNAGYTAYYCEGYIKDEYCTGDNCRHAFVELDNQYVEATTGKFISPQDFNEKYIKSFCIGK